MCWQTENKTYLVYVLGNAQKCRFQVSSLSWLQKSSIDREVDSIDRELQKKKFCKILNQAQARENV